MLKTMLRRFRVDLGEAEADYRVFYLRDDITQSILYIFIASLGVLSMVRVDMLIFRDQPDVRTWLMVSRAGFVLISLLVMVVLWRTRQPNRYDRVILGWLSFTVLFLLFSNLTRPSDFPTAIFDVMVTFAIYIFSPLRILYSVLLALIFSAGTIYIDHVYRAGIEAPGLNTMVATQLISHALGLVAGLRIQNYRRKSFKAYMQEKDARELAAYLANIDPLTKSLTRRQFFSIAEAEFLRYLRYRNPFSVLVIDADQFKKINDTYGHHTGDLVLQNLSLVILEQKRAQDTFGRLGGEEFGLVLPETTREKAKVVAERIQRVWAQSPSTVDDKIIHSTVSIGAAEAEPQDRSFEDVLRRADKLMYKAKQAGRNTVVAE